MEKDKLCHQEKLEKMKMPKPKPVVRCTKLAPMLSRNMAITTLLISSLFPNYYHIWSRKKYFSATSFFDIPTGAGTCISPFFHDAHRQTLGSPTCYLYSHNHLNNEILLFILFIPPQKVVLCFS